MPTLLKTKNGKTCTSFFSKDFFTEKLSKGNKICKNCAYFIVIFAPKKLWGVFHVSGVSLMKLCDANVNYLAVVGHSCEFHQWTPHVSQNKR